MADEVPPVLEYRRSRVVSASRRRVSWLIALLSGIAAGLLLSLSGLAIACIFFPLCFAASGTSATFAHANYFKFGVLSTVVGILVGIAAVTSQNWHFGTTLRMDDFWRVARNIALLMGVPGLLGSAVFGAMSRRRESRD